MHIVTWNGYTESFANFLEIFLDLDRLLANCAKTAHFFFHVIEL